MRFCGATIIQAAPGHALPCARPPGPQYDVASSVVLTTMNGTLLANTTAVVHGVPCPLPAFGGDGKATLLLERTWNW